MTKRAPLSHYGRVKVCKESGKLRGTEIESFLFLSLNQCTLASLGETVTGCLHDCHGRSPTFAFFKETVEVWGYDKNVGHLVKCEGWAAGERK